MICERAKQRARFNSASSRFLLAIAVLLPMHTSLFAGGISDIELGQLSWWDEYGTLAAPYSHWGRMDMDVSPDPVDVYYVNVLAKNGTLGTPRWIVQNVPLLASAAGASVRQSVDFDLYELGVPAGQQAPSLYLTTTVGAVPRTQPPPDPDPNLPWPDLLNVRKIDHNNAGDKLTHLWADVGRPVGHKVMGGVSNVIQHKNVPGVQVDVGRWCLPGAFARSLKWLDTEYSLGSGKTAQQIYDDLVALKVGSHGPGATTYEQDIGAKQAYFKAIDNRAITKVLDLGGIVGAIAGVTEVSLAPGQTLVDWLRQELPSEDVELHYAGHIVTVTGIYEQGGDTFLRFRDDEEPGKPALGDAGEKRAKLTLHSAKWYFRREGALAGSEIKVVISESIPEPSALILLIVAGLMVRWR